MFLIKRLSIDYFLIMFRHMWVFLIEKFQKIVRKLCLLTSCPPSLIEDMMTCWKSVCHCLSLLTWPTRRILRPWLSYCLSRLLFFSVLKVWRTGWNRGILHTIIGRIKHIYELSRSDRSDLGCVILCIWLRSFRIWFIWALVVTWLLFFVRSLVLVHRVAGARLVLKIL